MHKSIAFGHFLLLFRLLCAQTAILEPFPLQYGEFQILILESDPNRTDNARLRYIDDPTALYKLEKRMVFEAEATVFPFRCDVVQRMVVCSEGQANANYFISQNCHAIRGDLGEFFYTNELDTAASKPAFKTIESFTNIEAARDGIAKFREAKGILLVDEPAWLNFEGAFDLFLEHRSASRKEEEAVLRKKLAEKWGNEAYQLEFKPIGAPKALGHCYAARLVCNKSLYDRIDEFKKSELGFEAFPLVLECYWKEIQSK